MEASLADACPASLTMARAAVQMSRRLHQARENIKSREISGIPTPEGLPSHTRAAAEFSRSKTREDDILAGMKLLEQRLKSHNMQAEQMIDDGNCQFRALSHQLYGTQEKYAEVRQFVTEHIREHADSYALFCDEDIGSYLERMSADRTWGDELTLKAAVDAYNITLHGVTSNLENWHLKYEPDLGEEPKPDPVTPQHRLRSKLFVAYIAPVHYNSILPLEADH